MRKVRRALRIGFGLFVAIFANLTSAQDLKLRFSIPTPPSTYLLPYYVANDLGWYAKQGLTVEEVTVQGDPNALRLLIAGDAEVTCVGPSTIMEAVLKGGQIKMISSWQPIADYHIVIRSDKGGSLKDIVGRSIAITSLGSMTQHIPSMVMKKHGLDTSKTDFVPIGGMNARVQAVIAGKVDASMVDTFFATAAERQGGVKTIVSIAEEFPGLGYVMIATNAAQLSDPKMRQALSIFVRGGIEGSRFIVKEPAQAVELMRKRLPSADAALINEIIPKLNAQKVWGINGGIERDKIEFTATTYNDLAILPSKPSYEQLVDPSLVEAAIKEIGRI